ncbi:AbfB domain-containing protein [Deinococcus sp. HMF7604]|uniref:AbfB domain-containing protein n=1 Tax=Deinococcus betulae TaxID=2873312 RepID=UPI001CCE332F|nr:AbfB domain-containing protein [Deinococcus betulae]MBZ9750105.1 AbfB domain-containing protein [Deinococcus betulae]
MRPLPLLSLLSVSLLLASCAGTDGHDHTHAPETQASTRHSHDALWQAHHPTGDTLQVQLPDRDAPSTVTLSGGHAYLGDDIIGDVRGTAVVGLSGQTILRTDRSGIQPLSSGITDAGLKWPGAVVPFVFDGSATANIRTQFNQAVQIYNGQTVVRYVARTNQANYVRVVAGDGCSSYVGMMSTSFKPNGQEITLGRDGCGVGAALHEMGHAAGLEHEQQRQDRDSYITVNYGLIDPAWRSQYDIIRDNRVNTAFTGYDVHSIMHYGNSQVNSQWVMTSKQGVPPEQIGQNSGYLTDGDKTAFRTIYGNVNGGGGGQGITLTTGQWTSLQVVTPGFTNRFLRHLNSLGYTEVVTSGSSATLKQDATFRVVGALDGTGCYSLESRNFPGQFLRHQNNRLRIDRNDGSDLMRRDATFCAQTGLAGLGGVSFVSRNINNAYIRHRNGEVWLDVNDGSTAFKQDASWNLAGAWAP